MAQARFSPTSNLVNNLAEALHHFEKNLDVRKGQDVILAGARVGAEFIANGENTKYLVLYKREKYLYFNKHFPLVPEKGYAIIANIKLVHWAALQDMFMVTVFPDGGIYSVKAKTFWDFYEQWGCEHPSIKDEIALPFARWERINAA